MGDTASLVLTLALDEGEWSVSRHRRLTAGKEQSYQLHRRLRGPHTCFVKWKKPVLLAGLSHRLSSTYLAAMPATPSRFSLIALHLKRSL
jgi:hypothetical protein